MPVPGASPADVRPHGRRAAADPPLAPRRRGGAAPATAGHGGRAGGPLRRPVHQVDAMNLYRDGADGVAWHGDRVARECAEGRSSRSCRSAPPGPLRLRPAGNGPSVSFTWRPGTCW
ncbi:hypothetical protein HBB16_17255 [Pseudonocardia sp. MCCB 268]|nr:hypothetical protein [Pseudonocardia cytotoxica]